MAVSHSRPLPSSSSKARSSTTTPGKTSRFHLGRTGHFFLRSWWAWEISAAIVSIVTTIVLIAVLAWCNGRVQSTLVFSDAGITINTIVALLATVIRAALVLTVAGPLNQGLWNRLAHNNGARGHELRDVDTFGNAASDSRASLLLLWRTRGMALPALGAAVFILAIAFDAFSQQVLTTASIQTNSTDANVTLPRSVSLPSLMVSDGGGLAVTVAPKLPKEGAAAALSSFLASEAVWPHVTCPTGDCTWPTTPTLGICGTCIDQSDQIVLDSSTTNEGGSNLTFHVRGNERHPLTIQTGSFKTDSIDSEFFTGNISLVWTENSTKDEMNPAQSPNYTGQVVLLDYYELGIPRSNYEDFVKNTWFAEPASSTKIQSLLSAYKCSYTYCLQSLRAETKSGQTVESLDSTWDQFSSGPAVESLQPFNVPERMMIKDPSVYGIDQNSFVAFQDILITMLEGQVLLEVSSINNTNPPVAYPTLQYLTAQQEDSNFMEVLWNSTNSTQAMGALAEQVANGLTTYLRTAFPAPDDADYHAIIHTSQTIVQVRWAWLTYPLTLLIAGHIFLLATMWQTKRRRLVRPWKGHRMPLLLAELDRDIRDRAAGGLNTPGGLAARTGRIRVMLKYDEKDQIRISGATV